jgi:ABC-2 type transport system permease protein
VTRLFAGELIKVRTTRTAVGFSVAALLLMLASVLLSILAGKPTALVDKRSAIDFGGPVSIVLMIYGAVGATGEFRHRTLAPAVLIAPDRVRLVVARIGAYGASAAVFGVAIAITALAVGIPLLSGRAGPDLSSSDIISIAGGGLSAIVLSAALGVGAGTLVRNQVATVVGIFVWLLILEPLVGLLGDEWVKFTIGAAGHALSVGGSEDASMLTGAVVLASWTASVSILAALVDRRRDVE